jgi:hypothetical protein
MKQSGQNRLQTSKYANKKISSNYKGENYTRRSDPSSYLFVLFELVVHLVSLIRSCLFGSHYLGLEYKNLFVIPKINLFGCHRIVSEFKENFMNFIPRRTLIPLVTVIFVDFPNKIISSVSTHLGAKRALLSQNLESRFEV